MRKAMLLVSAEFFIEILKHPAQPGVTSEGIPDDARIVAADWAFPGVIRLAIASNTLPDVREGAPLPELRVLFRRNDTQRPGEGRENRGKNHAKRR